MKTSLTLFAILIILLPACNSNDTTTPTNGSGDTTTVQNHIPDDNTSAASLTAADTAEMLAHNQIYPDSVTEPVTPPAASDSLQFCTIKKLYEENGTLYIDADYIQLYYGDKAVEVAKKYNDAIATLDDKGDTVYSVLSDVYILNENKRIRKLAVDKNVSCYTVVLGKSAMRLKKSPLHELRIRMNDERPYIVLLDRNNVVTAIKEQYLP
jgi:hypothetical protein